jgi:hypothetical protein
LRTIVQSIELARRMQPSNSMSLNGQATKTVPPPEGEDDCYSAATALRRVDDILLAHSKGLIPLPKQEEEVSGVMTKAKVVSANSFDEEDERILAEPTAVISVNPVLVKSTKPLEVAEDVALDDDDFEEVITSAPPIARVVSRVPPPVPKAARGAAVGRLAVITVIAVAIVTGGVLAGRKAAAFVSGGSDVAQVK